MPSALAGSATCMHCAAPLAGDGCPVCGARQEPPAAGSALTGRDVLTAVAQAGAGRRRVAIAIDLIAILAPSIAAGTAVGLVADAALGALAAILVGALLTVAQVAALRSVGRSAGRAALGLRTVDNLTALPPTQTRALLAAMATARGRTALTADLSRGRDPLCRALPSVELAAVPTVGGTPLSAAVPVRTPAPEMSSARLVFDSGEELEVTGPVLIGRQPEPTDAARTVHALPDLSRGLAKTHALLDFADGLLWVTDLGSPNGTSIARRDGGAQPLVPGLRTAAAVGWRVRLGGRAFTVRATVARAEREAAHAE